MSLLASLGDDTMVVVHAPLVEDTTGANYGNPYLDWSAATRTTVEGVTVQPLPAAELVDPSRDAVVTRYTLIAPADTALDAVDRVEWQGIAFEVDGAPMIWRTGVLDHVEAILQMVRG